MAYRMEYDLQTIQKIEIRKGRQINKKYLVTILVIVSLVMSCLFSWRYGGLLELLLPGEGVRAKVALEQMVADLAQGESFQDSITAFCQEIIAYDYSEN